MEDFEWVVLAADLLAESFGTLLVHVEQEGSLSDTAIENGRRTLMAWARIRAEALA